MNFRYGCFLSYAHGSGELMRRFNHEFAEVLGACLEPYFDDETPMFVDAQQLGGGDDIFRRIADAIWHSPCMVMIYTPKYEYHLNTRREYAAMLELEKLRRQWGRLSGRLVFPVVLRTHPVLGVPPQVMQAYYLDFSPYSVMNDNFRLHPEFIPQIEVLAQRIGTLHHEQKEIIVPPEYRCNQFALPEVTPPWRDMPSSNFPKI